MSSSSTAPQSQPSVPVLSDVFEAEKEDTKRSLCTEVGLLADAELDSLVLKITQKLVTNKKITRSGEGAKESFRADLNRRVETVVDSHFKRLTNKSMEFDLARLDSVNGGGECAVVVNPTNEQSATSGGSTRVKSVPLGPVCNCPSPHPHVELHPEVKVEVKEEEVETPTLKQPKTRKQKRTATTSTEVSTPVPKKRSNRTREPSPLDRTESVEQLSTGLRVDLMDDSIGGGGEGSQQSDEEDDETELAEEDQGGHYKIAIVKLKCTEDGCEDEVADRDELHHHLRVIHHLSPYRCLAEGCNERFEQWGELGNHVRNNHSNISTWSCPHCNKTFKSHARLYMHLHYNHFEGQFKCGYDSCHYDRVATLRSEIRSHQISVHPNATKPTIFTCQFNNCGKSFNQKGNFNSHQRMHQNVKPFKCTWKKCGYAATHQSHVISHIRAKHFHLPLTQKKQRELGIEDNRDPRDYLLKELHN